MSLHPNFSPSPEMLEPAPSAIIYVHSWMRKVYPFVFHAGREWTWFTWQGFGITGKCCSCDFWEQGLFQRLQRISAPAPWSASCSISNLGVLSAISFPHFLRLSSIFCFFLSLFSLRCHRLGGWAQLCIAADPPWSWLCLAQSMPWSPLTEASPAANTCHGHPALWEGKQDRKSKVISRILSSSRKIVKAVCLYYTTISSRVRALRAGNSPLWLPISQSSKKQRKWVAFKMLYALQSYAVIYF